MKHFLKATLPPAVLNAARNARDALILNTIPRQIFNATHLSETYGFDPAALFQDPAIEQDWHRDHEAILSVLNDEDRLEGVNPGDRRALYYLIRGLKPMNVLEIGTHIGASTLYIAQALKTCQNRGKVTTVDIIDVNDPLEGPWKN